CATVARARPSGIPVCAHTRGTAPRPQNGYAPAPWRTSSSRRSGSSSRNVSASRTCSTAPPSRPTSGASRRACRAATPRRSRASTCPSCGSSTRPPPIVPCTRTRRPARRASPPGWWPQARWSRSRSARPGRSRRRRRRPPAAPRQTGRRPPPAA
ncbi:MAG: SSU ribosomal protein S20p, partial [uncultured Thermoleophilia bacterium]